MEYSLAEWEHAERVRERLTFLRLLEPDLDPKTPMVRAMTILSMASADATCINRTAMWLMRKWYNGLLTELYPVIAAYLEGGERASRQAESTHHHRGT